MTLSGHRGVGVWIFVFRVSFSRNMNLKRFLRVLLVATAAIILTTSPLFGAETNFDAAIRRVRMGKLVVQTTPGAEVRVEQLRHEFWFGAALANQFFGSQGNSATAE